jgi:hypothetical protein
MRIVPALRGNEATSEQSGFSAFTPDCFASLRDQLGTCAAAAFIGAAGATGLRETGGGAAAGTL